MEFTNIFLVHCFITSVYSSRKAAIWIKRSGRKTSVLDSTHPIIMQENSCLTAVFFPLLFFIKFNFDFFWNPNKAFISKYGTLYLPAAHSTTQKKNKQHELSEYALQIISFSSLAQHAVLPLTNWWLLIYFFSVLCQGLSGWTFLPQAHSVFFAFTLLLLAHLLRLPCRLEPFELLCTELAPVPRIQP